MREIQISFLLTFLLLGIASGIFPKNVYKSIKKRPVVGDPGAPLFLTPLIQNHQIEEAQNASKVHFADFNSTVSYSGYLTTDESYNSSLFFWYFPAENGFEDAPLLLWLQGGPGSSSLIGLFVEHGPFVIDGQGRVQSRKYSWTKDHSVVYIDNPVGTGFSTTNMGYAQNETKVGADLYVVLTQLLTLFPELQDKPFFITGESYAGKFVPALAHTIHINNPQATLKINFKGFLIGNGYSDPINQVGKADYLYQLGLIDSNARDVMSSLEAIFQVLVEQEDYEVATAVLDEVLGLFASRSGFSNVYNYLFTKDPNEAEEYYFGEFVQRSDVRQAIHVGDMPFGDDGSVHDYISKENVMSVAPWISELLSYYPALLYSGQTDVIVAYPLTLNYLQKLHFSAAAEYKIAPRKLWYVGDGLAGYVKRAGNLTEMLVRNSGHLVPADQPKWAYDMVYRFVRSQPFQESPQNNTK